MSMLRLSRKGSCAWSVWGVADRQCGAPGRVATKRAAWRGRVEAIDFAAMIRAAKKSRDTKRSSLMNESPQRSVVMISSYIPRRCGIATFTHELVSALADSTFRQPLRECTRVGVAALTDTEDGYAYPPEVVHEIRQHSKEDYRSAADFLNHSKFDVVCVQHEYGIYGGEDGAYLLALLERLHKPVVSVFHTVLTAPSAGQRDVLRRLCQRSSAVVVMAGRAKQILQDVFEVPGDKIHHIHHGVPDVSFGDTEPFKPRFQVSGRPTILTFGLLGPSKGIEAMLEALPAVVHEHPDVAYIVLGATHPGVKRESGESYRLSLEKLALDLGIARNVIFHNRYVSTEDLCEYLRAADIYVTPYPGKAQIVSGTLAYAVACGTAVISTPYWYAEEVLANGRGRLVGFGDSEALARTLRELLTDETERARLRREAYAFSREMVWSQVAGAHAAVHDQACRAPLAEVVQPAPTVELALRLSLPEVRLDHLFRMTDDTGVLQHAVHATPNRRHGYSIDDVARGTIVASMHYTLFREETTLELFHTYLSYMHFARVQGGRYHNFMSYDRRWIDTVGSDDAQGRVLWSLGYVVAHPPDDLSQELCKTMFEETVPIFEQMRHPRALSFAILGCYYFLRRFPDGSWVERTMRVLADRILAYFREHEAEDWPWLGRSVTYENGRIPQGLLLAGLTLGDDQLVEQGLRSLDWLLGIQTGDAGQVSLIGNNGWLQRGHPKADYDQQPVELAALVGACKAAYRATDDSRYLNEMRRCFDWFLGSNDAGAPLIDFKSRGCYDGLTASGVNLNQGAESLVCWLLSLLIMHELQTGDPKSAG